MLQYTSSQYVTLSSSKTAKRDTQECSPIPYMECMECLVLQCATAYIPCSSTYNSSMSEGRARGDTTLRPYINRMMPSGACWWYKARYYVPILLHADYYLQHIHTAHQWWSFPLVRHWERPRHASPAHHGSHQHLPLSSYDQCTTHPHTTSTASG